MKKVQKLLYVVLGVVSVSHAAPQLTLDAFNFEALDKAYSDISENIGRIKGETSFTGAFIGDGGIEKIDPEVIEDYALLECCMKENYSYLEIVYYKFKSAISLIPKTNEGYTESGAFVRFLTFMSNNKSLAILSGPEFDRGIAYALQIPLTVYEKFKKVAVAALKGAAMAQITLPFRIKGHIDNSYAYPDMLKIEDIPAKTAKNILYQGAQGALVGGLYGAYKAFNASPSRITEPLRKKKSWLEWFGFGKNS